MRYSEAELCRLRTRMGMIFQQFNLFPHMTALENVMEGPFSVLGKSRNEARQIALKHLTRVGLADKIDQYPSRLSGGQQQRVAIARALAMEPEMLLFDEPTSSLDPKTSVEVMELFDEIAERRGIPVIINIHNVGLAKRYARRIIGMSRGQVIYDGPPAVAAAVPA